MICSGDKLAKSDEFMVWFPVLENVIVEDITFTAGSFPTEILIPGVLFISSVIKSDVEIWYIKDFFAFPT